MKGRLIGVDYGSKRIGLAISDGLAIAARELAVIHCSTRERDFEQILKIVRKHRAAGFVVGIPHSPNAPQRVRKQADTVRRWVDRLREYTSMPVAEVSEYLTSVEARELARQKHRKPDEPIDDLAARIILQSYLDALHRSSAARQSCGSTSL